MLQSGLGDQCCIAGTNCITPGSKAEWFQAQLSGASAVPLTASIFGIICSIEAANDGSASISAKRAAFAAWKCAYLVPAGIAEVTERDTTLYIPFSYLQSGRHASSPGNPVIRRKTPSPISSSVSILSICGNCSPIRVRLPISTASLQLCSPHTSTSLPITYQHKLASTLRNRKKCSTL